MEFDPNEIVMLCKTCENDQAFVFNHTYILYLKLFKPLKQKRFKIQNV